MELFRFSSRANKPRRPHQVQAKMIVLSTYKKPTYKQIPGVPLELKPESRSVTNHSTEQMTSEGPGRTDPTST